LDSSDEAALVDLAIAVGAALTARGWMLATVESCTGGLAAAAITAVPGSSGWFERGFVTYSNRSKIEMLGVQPETLAAQGAVSEAVAAQMAHGGLAASAAGITLSITGVAGPDGGTADKPVGLVCFGWAWRDADGVHVETASRRFDGDRAAVRSQATVHALQGVLQRAPRITV
jgi:nicotinamide-nucleotide amidase